MICRKLKRLRVISNLILVELLRKSTYSYLEKQRLRSIPYFPFTFMRVPLLLLSSLALLVSCTGTPSLVEEGGSITPEIPCTGYKSGFMGGEVPVTWSVAYLGDVGPMPLPPSDQTWLDPEHVMFSFASHGIAFGDINWEQVDIVPMAPEDISTFVANIKANGDAAQWIEDWTTQIVDGQEAQVLTFSVNPDGSVDKGATGGAMYFFPKSGWIFHKQALGSKEFEEGFTRFLATVHFGSGIYSGQ